MNLTPFEQKFFNNEDVKGKTHLCVVMTSERGLCGSFNSQIIKAVKRDITKYQEQNVKVKLIIAGKKGYDALKNQYSDLIEEYYHITKEQYLPVSLEIKNKIISARVEKTLKTKILLEQPFIRDSNITVEDYIKQTIATLGENIKVRRFIRYVLGELDNL